MKKLLSALLFLPCLLSGYDGISIQYEPGARVTQTHSLEWNLNIAIPENPLRTSVTQIIECELRVLEDGVEPLEEGPFDVELVLKRVAMELDTNGVVEKLDSSEKSESPHMAVLAQITDRPLRLRVGRDLTLQRENPDLDKLLERFPTLDHLLSQQMIHELFQPLFSVGAGRISAGTIKQSETHIGNRLEITLPVNYEITRADYREVEAALSGDADPVTVNAEGRTMVAGGHTEGKVSWSRRNALLCQMKLQQDYNGTLKIAGSELAPVPVTGTCVHKIQSRRRA